MNLTAKRARFVENSVSTASPAKLLVMLFDRLVLDLQRGELAIAEGDRQAVSEHVTHAQDIVAELASSLDVSAWPAGEQLHAVYMYLLRELVRANVNHDAEALRGCIEMVEPLRDAWRTAASELAMAEAAGSPQLGVG